MFEERQEEDLRRLNDLILSQSIQHEQTPSNKKMFNPQTGELTLWVDNERGGAKFTSINLFGD
jgi:hypothetical protein